MGPTTNLYLDQGNHNVLFLNRHFSNMRHRKKHFVQPISALFISACLLTHSTSFVFSPLNNLSLVCAFSFCILLYFLSSLHLSSPLRSSFFLHLTGFRPPIFFLLICSCVWIKPSNICLWRSLKNRKKMTKSQVLKSRSPWGFIKN